MKTNIRPTVSIKKHLAEQDQKKAAELVALEALEAAIQMVKDAGYKVYKRIENWEEI
jgi:hypothetical protein